MPYSRYSQEFYFGLNGSFVLPEESRVRRQESIDASKESVGIGQECSHPTGDSNQRWALNRPRHFQGMGSAGFEAGSSSRM
jgi:hypothetical protein